MMFKVMGALLRKGVVKYITLPFFLIALPAHADWAGDIEHFVDNDVPQLTKKYVEDDLKKRWLDAYLSPFAETIKLQMEIADRVNNRRVPKIDGQVDVRQAIEILRSIDVNLASLRFDQSRLEHLSMILDRLHNSCDDPAIYGGNAIASLGTLAISNVTLPDRFQFILVWFGDPYFISTAISAVYSIVNWDQDKHRRKRASEALERIPRQVASAEWTIPRSREICKEVLSLRSDALKRYKASIEKYQEALNDYQKAQWTTYHHLEVTLGEAAFIDVFQRAGIWKQEVARAQRLASASLLIDLELAKNEIHLLQIRAAKANSCRAGIVSIEVFEDALVELRAQLTVYLNRPQLPETAKRLADTLEWLNLQTSKPQVFYTAAKGRQCLS